MQIRSFLPALMTVAVLGWPAAALAQEQPHQQDDGHHWSDRDHRDARDHGNGNGRWQHRGDRDDRRDRDDRGYDNGYGNGGYNRGYNNGGYNRGYNNGGYNNGGYNRGYGNYNGRVNGYVTSFGGFNLQLNNGPAIHLHQGTIINPTGTTLQNGMRVNVTGHPNGDGSFEADRIDVIGNQYGYGNGYGSYGSGIDPNAVGSILSRFGF